MDILKKLSFENLKLNKKRTISTIIGIILSCALICATATLVTSFRETLIQYEANSRGYYHLEISGAEDSDIEDFKNNRDIKDVLNIYENGYGRRRCRAGFCGCRTVSPGISGCRRKGF